jgi:lysozyme
VVQARAQADWFVANARLGAANLVPALDLEVNGGKGPIGLRRWTLAWLSRVRARLGVAPIVYTNPAFWRNAMGNTRAIAQAGFHVLWIAHWGTGYPDVPAGGWNGNGWVFWQWTRCGHVPGIAGCVDRDTFRGRAIRDLTIGSARAAD